MSVLPAGWQARDGELLVGGTGVRRLAARAGGTPFYAYDRARIAARVAALRAALPAGVHLHYALKANPHPALVQLLAGLVDGGDVASAGELRLALDAGMAAERVGFAGPGKRDEELRAAAAAGVMVHLESAREVAVLAAIAADTGWRPPVALRLNPEVQLKGAGMRMGGGPRPFGVDAEQAPALLRAILDAGLDWRGFHVYAGSQNLRATAIIETQQACLDLALRLADGLGRPLRHLNLGGGFGIPYFPGDQPLDLAAVGAGMAPLVARLAAAQPQAVLSIELGRYLVGEAGVYVTRILDRKVSRGQVFLVCDGGLHHHLAASGNFGQTVRRDYPLAVATRLDEPDAGPASVVGPLCTPLDLLGDRCHLPDARPGDLVAVFQSGAYGASASPQDFLGHPHVREMVV